MKMSIGQTLNVLPNLRQERSGIPKIGDPCLGDFPNRTYRWNGVGLGVNVATLDMRAWRLNGTLGCYFRTDDGRKFQVSGTWDVATSAWGANDAEVDFSSNEVRLGDRFILKLERDPDTRCIRWVGAMREEARKPQRIAATLVTPSQEGAEVRNFAPRGEFLRPLGPPAGPPPAPVERSGSSHADPTLSATGTDSRSARPTHVAEFPGQHDAPRRPVPQASYTHAKPSSVTPIVVALGITFASAASLVMRRLASAR